MDKIIFLDRDGTINIDNHGYISKAEDMNLFPNSGKAIKKFKDMGFKVVVVTNQSGIGRGYFTFEQLDEVNKQMIKLLADSDAIIDDILISPHHPEGVIEPYNIVHEDRKPGIGLLKKYYAKCNFKSSKSFMIGDKISDIMLGNNFNLTTILVLTGNGLKTFQNRAKYKVKPHFIVEDLYEAAKLIENLKK